MQTVEYKTMIGENIPLPTQYKFLSNKMAKIIIVYEDGYQNIILPNENIQKTKEEKYSAIDFINEYAGFIKGVTCEDEKYNRIMQKHA